MTHIICSEKAAIPIKSYSPEAMVHPLLLDSLEIERVVYLEKMEPNMKKIQGIVFNCSSLVIGPGLGRSTLLFEFLVKNIFPGVKNKPIIMDADFLWFLSSSQAFAEQFEFNFPDFLSGLESNNNSIILTPNQIEMHRLSQSLGFKNGMQEYRIEDVGKAQKAVFEYLTETYKSFPEIKEGLYQKITNKELQSIPNNSLLAQLSDFLRKYKTTSVFLKGQVDLIFNTSGEVFCVGIQGNQKRVGGQGDILAGMLAANHSFSASAILKESDKQKIPVDQTILSEKAVFACLLSSLVMRVLGN